MSIRKESEKMPWALSFLYCSVWQNAIKNDIYLTDERTRYNALPFDFSQSSTGLIFIIYNYNTLVSSERKRNVSNIKTDIILCTSFMRDSINYSTALCVPVFY